MLYSQLTFNIRYSEELHHRRRQVYFFTFKPLTFTLSRPNLQVEYEQSQDSCNKSTAIYWLVRIYDLIPSSTRAKVDTALRPYTPFTSNDSVGIT